MRYQPIVYLALAFSLTFCVTAASHADSQISATSPDRRNVITLEFSGKDRAKVRFTVSRNGQQLIGPSPLGPALVGGSLGDVERIENVKGGSVDESFTIPWGKTRSVRNHYTYSVFQLVSPSKLHWEIELRAFDDGVAFRYRVPKQDALSNFELSDEATCFNVVGEPSALFDVLQNFTTSHEALYQHKSLPAIPARKLLDMPLLLTWPKGPSAAITEGRVLHFAGMYLKRDSADNHSLQCRLSPLPSRPGVCVTGKAPLESPWRVVLLADVAGKLLESNLLLCLNDPPRGDFSWAKPGKTSFHWWYGEFEDDYKLPSQVESKVYVQRHREYIDFCAKNNIAYHAVSGDGFSWYKQSHIDYGHVAPDADVLTARPELDLPAIIAYANERGVGIRLWVHWKPLSEHLEAAFTRYESWGVKGLMVDFLDRDDQEMIDFTERLLESAARHKLHIQIHGSSKFSGEQRAYPNLFNREGVLNLEYLKWSNRCTPDHSVNVAYTRALAGPVDFHLGGFRSVSRAEFKPHDRAPNVMGTRCHMLALYVVFENPMPMVADAPQAYENQPGFDFIKEVPTTWDETRFVAGEPGEFIVVARRKDNAWYLGGITNWTPREIDLPLRFLPPGKFDARQYVDGSMDESKPNAIRAVKHSVDVESKLKIKLAPGGGFVAVLRPQ